MPTDRYRLQPASHPSPEQIIASHVFLQARRDLRHSVEAIRADAAAFLTQPRHGGRAFWSQVLGVPDDVLVQHAPTCD